MKGSVKMAYTNNIENIDNGNELQADQKMAKVMLKLRLIRPFYSAIYEAMEKIETDIDTMAVSTHKMFYNKEFVNKTKFSELLFVNLHEIAHIALMHVARQDGRDQNLWNIACDLYVNAALADEFKLKPDKEIEIANTKMKMPYNCLYCESLDLNNDYVEKIYNDLDKQAKENGYFTYISSGAIGHSKNNDGNNDDNYECPSFSFSFTGSKTEYDNWQRVSNNNRNWTFRFKLSPDKFTSDLVDSGEDQASKMQSARKIVSDATVKADMTSSGVGNQTSDIERNARKLFESVIDWKRLLNRYLVVAKSKDSSFSRPDKRFYYQKAIYPGLVSDDLGAIEGIKICIDTSGSISDADLGHFFYQVSSLAKQYKIDAEVLYWDTEIKSVGTFTNLKEFTSIDCLGGGGTNPNCIFDYFINNKISPVVTLVLTDGIWHRDWITDKIKRRYKNTIWILTKDTVNDFEPPFGKKAQITWKEK